MWTGTTLEVWAKKNNCWHQELKGNTTSSNYSKHNTSMLYPAKSKNKTAAADTKGSRRRQMQREHVNVILRHFIAFRRSAKGTKRSSYLWVKSFLNALYRLTEGKAPLHPLPEQAYHPLFFLWLAPNHLPGCMSVSAPVLWLLQVFAAK